LVDDVTAAAQEAVGRSKMMSITLADKRTTFRKLHEAGCLMLPNPFDVGSALALQHLGFKALASTSAGFA
jgi:2-methylisocitrate lyase-like PEP mutase family enzyme